MAWPSHPFLPVHEPACLILNAGSIRLLPPYLNLNQRSNLSDLSWQAVSNSESWVELMNKCHIKRSKVQTQRRHAALSRNLKNTFAQDKIANIKYLDL